jgi:hypothetical protein
VFDARFEASPPEVVGRKGLHHLALAADAVFGERYMAPVRVSGSSSSIRA